MRCQASCCPGSWDLACGRRYTDRAPSVKDTAVRGGRALQNIPLPLLPLSVDLRRAPGTESDGKAEAESRLQASILGRAEERRVGVGGQREDQSSFNDEQSQR